MKIKKTIKLMSTKFLDFKETTYINNDDKESSWIWVQRPNARKAVVVVAVVDKGFKEMIPGGYERDLRLIVIKEMRVPLKDYEWGFPAGLVDGDEDIVTAAKRELTEETGLKVKTVLRSTPYVYNSAGLTDESIAMVYVECEGEISKDGLEASEDIETFVLTRTEVANLLEDKNKKFGAKFWIIADYFVRNNEI